MATSQRSGSSIMAFMPGVVFWQNMDFIFQDCNLDAAHLFGYNSTDNMIGETPFQFKCKAVESAEEYVKLDKQALSSEKTIRSIILDTFASGDAQMHLVIKKPMVDTNNQNIGLLTQGLSLGEKNPIADFGCILAKRDNHKNKSFCYQVTTEIAQFNLKEREIECLFYYIRGKTMKDIAEILCLTTRTIEFHMENIRQKMNCANKSQLIEKPLNSGLLWNVPQRLLANKFIIIL